MKLLSTNLRKSALTLAAWTITFSCFLLLGSALAINAQTKSSARTFSTPKDAADALIEAAGKFDEAELKEILGPNGNDIIYSGEPARDKEIAMQFAALAKMRQRVTRARNAGRATLVVGYDDWPFPAPIVRRPNNKWSFDSAAGLQEILRRRVGRNELDAIEICRGFVEAQHEYALMKKTGGVNQYAQRIISTEGQQDGLAWKNADGTWDGPIGEKAAQAITRGYHSGDPYHGYFFKVLKGQGPSAPLGQLDFVVKGVMIGGFALIATPAQYRITGVKTFMVSHDGVVYEKDLGPKTLEIFQAVERFNPDGSWKPVSEAVDYKVKPGE